MLTHMICYFYSKSYKINLLKSFFQIKKLKFPNQTILNSLIMQEEDSFLPLSKDRFKRLLEKLPDFKESNETLFLPEFSMILKLLHHLIDSNDSRGVYKEENSPLFDYLISEVFISVAKTLIFAKSFRNKELLEVSNQILEAMIFFSFKSIEEDNQKLLELLKFILDPSRAYYKLNDQEENNLFSVFSSIEN